MTMPSFHVITRRSTLEIVLFLIKLQKSKDERRARLDEKYRERPRSLFNGNHFSSYLLYVQISHKAPTLY